MFSALMRFLGLIKVIEQGDFIVISGLPADFINLSINKIWATSKIATNMFNRITNNQIVFHKFFAPDVIYTLNVVAKDKRARTYVPIIEKIVEEIYANTWTKTILEEAKPFLDRNALSEFKKEPLPHQIDFFNQYERNTQKYQLKGYLLGAVPGSGKAHPLTVKLKTEQGFIYMRNVKVGDTLLDRRLKPTKVTGVFPQGVKDIYTVTLEDGRTTEACYEHLWQAYMGDLVTPKVVDTARIDAALKAHRRVYLDLPGIPRTVKDVKTTAQYDKKKSLVEQGVSYYRSLGALVEVKEKHDCALLEVEFRASHKIEVKSITYKGKEETQCISVDNAEELYIVDDYIVTHNTIASVMLSRMLKTDTNFFFVPKNSLDRVWRATFETEFKKRQNFWISNSDKPLKPGYKDYIIHHDHIVKVMEELDHFKGEFGNTYINVDESHFFNEVKSARTNNVVTIARDILDSLNTLFMSGTPLKAVGSEAIPLLRIIDSYFNPKVEERFLKIYGKSQSKANDILQNRMGTLTFKVDKAVAVGNEVHVQDGYVKISNGSDYTLDSIRSEMKKFITERLNYYKAERSGFDKEYLRIVEGFKKTLETKEERVAFEAYQKAVEMIRNHYDPILRKEDIVEANKYERYRIIPHLTDEDKRTFRDVKSVYKYYFLKVQGEALGRILGKLREQCNIDMLQGLDNIVIKDKKGVAKDSTSLEKEIFSTKKKTILFTSFVGVVDAAKALLEKKGFKPLIVYGRTNKELASIVSEFASNEEANPLIATFKSLSTAVPLTMANVTIMLNAPFRDYEFQQAIARTDRVGQDSPVYCTLVYLDTDNQPNISTRSKDIMEWSKQQIEEILGFKIDERQVSLEDEGSEAKDPVQSLAEALDIGVPEVIGEDEPHSGETVEGSKAEMRKMYWSSWE